MTTTAIGHPDDFPKLRYDIRSLDPGETNENLYLIRESKHTWPAVVEYVERVYGHPLDPSTNVYVDCYIRSREDVEHDGVVYSLPLDVATEFYAEFYDGEWYVESPVNKEDDWLRNNGRTVR
jgi:hypothetical protein